MVKPSIIPEGAKKEAMKDASKGKEASLPAFAVIPLGTENSLSGDDEVVNIPVVERPRKCGLCLCIFMLMTLVLIIGLAVTLFMGHASGKYVFRCGVGFSEDKGHKDFQEGGGSEEQGKLEEEVEVDPYKGYEQIDVPAQDYCERLTIIHDFTVNLTAYKLRSSGVCYIAKLDRAIVMDPDEFVARAEHDPEFLTDHYETVHETYRVVLPEIPSVDSKYGFFIPLVCYDVPSYWIEKIPEEELEDWDDYWADLGPEGRLDESRELPMPQHRRRRDVETVASKAMEFTGKFLRKIKIFKKDIADAIGAAKGKKAT